VGQFHVCSKNASDGILEEGSGARRERSMNATPSMSRLNARRAAVITGVEGVSERVVESGPEGCLSSDWADEVIDRYRECGCEAELTLVSDTGQ